MTLCLFFRDRAMAYSATTVLPALVWAATRTDWSFSIQRTAWDWNGSRVNLYVFAGSLVCKVRIFLR